MRHFRLGLAIACAAAGLVLAGYRIRCAQQANALQARALRLLRPPLAEAVSYRDVRAVEARELLEHAQALSHSEKREALLAEAQMIALMQRDHFARARRALAGVPEAARSPQLRVRAAELALAQDDVQRARAELERVDGTPRDQPSTWLVRSDVARASGDAEAALHAAQRGLARSPQSAALLERRGLARELLADYADARADFERAAELDRNAASPLIALGRVLHTVGDERDAVLAFHGAAQRSPDNAQAWLGSGLCRAALGDRISARSDLERAAELAPTRAQPLMALGDLDVADGAMPRALGRYRAATLLDHDDAASRVKLGNALMRTGAVAEAATAFRSAIERRPELAAAHNGLGAALLAQKELDAAEIELKAAAQLDPSDAHPMLNLARLYRRRGNGAAAATAIAQAQARDPQLLIVQGNPSQK